MRRWIATAVLVLSIGTEVASAQDYTVVDILSDPPGASVYVGKGFVGFAPGKVLLPSGSGTAELTLVRRGFDAWTREIDLGALPEKITAELTRSRARIPVTVADDRDPAADGQITLREALLYASGALRPRGTDQARIQGNPGADHPDDIVFAIENQGDAPVINVVRELPALSDAGDAIYGSSNLTTIAARPGTDGRGAGLIVHPGTRAENLLLDGFDIGLLATGDGLVTASGISAQGGVIGFYATQGAELLLSGADGLNGFRNVMATEGGLIDGFVEPILRPDGERVTLISGAPGSTEDTILEGWFQPGPDTNIFVRRDDPIPLTEVQGLEARSSSYDVYEIFGHGHTDQRWPRHVYDGLNGSYFQWALGNSPEREYLRVQGQRPMRTESFLLHHLQKGSTLHRYTFMLTDRSGAELWSTEVASDGLQDLIEVDPELDFFGFRINVIEATGSGPGFTEIEAMVQDPNAYSPRSFSRSRIVFPRPESGERGIVEIRGELLLIEEELFADLSQHDYPQAPAPSAEPPATVLTLPNEATSADLTNALDSLDGDGPAIVEIPGTLSIDGAADPISRLNLTLTGGGTVISMDGSPFRIEATADVSLRNLNFDSVPLVVVQARSVRLSEVTVSNVDTGIEALNSDLTVANSEMSASGTAIHTTDTSLLMYGTRISESDVGVSVGRAHPVTLIDNDIKARRRPFETRREGSGTSYVNLIANRGTPVAPDEPPSLATSHVSASVVADNDPPMLTFTEGRFEGSSRPDWIGSNVIDLRNGSAPASLRLVVIDDPELRCMVFASLDHPPVNAPRRLAPKYSALFHDTDLTLRCSHGHESASAALPVGSSDIPSVAEMRVSFEPGFDEFEEGLQTSGTLVLEPRRIGRGEALPRLGGRTQHRGLTQLVKALISSGNPGHAFAESFAAFEVSPNDSTLSDLALYSADQWANALVADGDTHGALVLYEDIAALDPPLPGAIELLEGNLGQIAFTQLEAGDWAGSRRLYRRLLERQPEHEAATANIRFSYQEEARKIMDADGVGGMLTWAEAEISAHPDARDPILAAGNSFLSNATVEAYDSGEFARAIELAATHYRWQPESGAGDNLLASFSAFALQAVEAGQTDVALSTFRTLNDEFGSRLDLAGGVEAAFLIATQEAMERGDVDAALSTVTILHEAAPSQQSAEFLGWAYQEKAQQITANEGPLAALDYISAQSVDGALIPQLADAARTIGNNSAIDAYNAGNFEVAEQILLRALDLIGSNENLESNLRVVLANWSVDAANGGRKDEALAVAKRGRERFPQEPTFQQVIDFASQ